MQTTVPHCDERCDREQALMLKYGGKDKKIDMDELRQLLTDLDDKKHPPLPKDLL